MLVEKLSLVQPRPLTRCRANALVFRAEKSHFRVRLACSQDRASFVTALSDFVMVEMVEGGASQDGNAFQSPPVAPPLPANPDHLEFYSQPARKVEWLDQLAPPAYKTPAKRSLDQTSYMDSPMKKAHYSQPSLHSQAMNRHPPAWDPLEEKRQEEEMRRPAFIEESFSSDCSFSSGSASSSPFLSQNFRPLPPTFSQGTQTEEVDEVSELSSLSQEEMMEMLRALAAQPAFHSLISSLSSLIEDDDSLSSLLQSTDFQPHTTPYESVLHKLE